MNPFRPNPSAVALAVLLGLVGGCQSPGGDSGAASAYERWRDEARLLEAGRFLEAGDVASASRELEAWTGADGTARGYLLRAELALRLGDEAGAAQALAEGLAAFPEDPGLVVLGARNAMERADWPRAVALHRTWIALAPGDPAPVAGLIRSLVASGRTAEAARLGDRALERFPTDRRLAALVGDAWFVAGEELGTAVPEDGDAWLDLARAEFLAGDRRSAVSMARRARREGADPAAASLLEARALALLGRVEAAGDAYAAALGAGASEEVLRPELVRLQELLGNAAYADGSALARPREAAFHDG